MSKFKNVICMFVLLRINKLRISPMIRFYSWIIKLGLFQSLEQSYNVSETVQTEAKFFQKDRWTDVTMRKEYH